MERLETISLLSRSTGAAPANEISCGMAVPSARTPPPELAAAA
eukprot:CAMPEP_0194406046 /NCGR_PEP_ID=MMETSP0176-20130528/4363_1 /TAXON_ID=216777 /ORGANISM="Proboscia alata, Strain PI-D3" /LENGTH=42 /DNA_ID= /DNA_START= /DNA_END= /DNA_ORIENTATION=